VLGYAAGSLDAAIAFGRAILFLFIFSFFALVERKKRKIEGAKYLAAAGYKSCLGMPPQ
jgi:hypothetical protein